MSEVGMGHSQMIVTFFEKDRLFYHNGLALGIKLFVVFATFFTLALSLLFGVFFFLFGFFFSTLFVFFALGDFFLEFGRGVDPSHN